MIQYFINRIKFAGFVYFSKIDYLHVRPLPELTIDFFKGRSKILTLFTFLNFQFSRQISHLSFVNKFVISLKIDEITKKKCDLRNSTKSPSAKFLIFYEMRYVNEYLHFHLRCTQFCKNLT